MKNKISQIFCTVELESQEGNNIPILSISGFEQRDRQNSQNLNNDSFCRLPVTSAHCIIRKEKIPDVGILLIYVDVDYCQEYLRFEEVSRALTKKHISQSYINVKDFRSTNVDAAGENDKSDGCTLYTVLIYDFKEISQHHNR